MTACRLRSRSLVYWALFRKLHSSSTEAIRPAVAADLSLTPPLTLTAARSWGRVAVKDGAMVAAWTEWPHPNESPAQRLCTARVDVVSPPLCSDEATDLRHDPAIAVGPDAFLLAWSERTNGVDDLRIDITPKPSLPSADRKGRIISEIAEPQGPPAIERKVDGGVVAVWNESDPVSRHSEIRIGGLDASGLVVPDRAVMPTGHDQYDPQISIANGRYLITWNDASTPLQRLGTVVDGATGVASPPITVGSATNTAMASDGKTSARHSVRLFAWSNQRAAVLHEGDRRFLIWPNDLALSSLYGVTA